VSFSKEVQALLKREHLAYVATSKEDSDINIAIKAVIDFSDEEQKIYFLDMFKGTTRRNLQQHPKTTIAIADLKNFCAYQFKGSVSLIESGEIFEKYTANWNMEKQNRFRERISQNLSKALIGSLKDAISGEITDEFDLPKPKYIIELTVEEIITLSPFKN